MEPSDISIILPARDEAGSLDSLLPRLRQSCPHAQILVVDDGSVDHTAQCCAHHGVDVISHPYAMGNGAAIKTGARNASGSVLVLMDADGQHPPEQIDRLLERYRQGHEMVVAARPRSSQASLGRSLANRAYNRLASWLCGHRVQDLTSGFRVVQADKFREFLHILPNGFSYPSSITMAFFRSGYAVAYVPVEMEPRSAGKSHVRILREGNRFLYVIFRICVLYSPLKLFAPVSLLCLTLGGLRYLYTYLAEGRFTNMSLLFFVLAIAVLMMGLLSEQITLLLYDPGRKREAGAKHEPPAPAE